MNLRDLFKALNSFGSVFRAKRKSAYGKETLQAYNETRDISSPDLICHAPFSSINFEQGGNANACCYNRTYILGAYPQQSIKEIWFGEKAAKLRKFMADGDLSRGCQICMKQLESRNFQAVHARHFDIYEINATQFEDGQQVPMPQGFEFELENTCNLECTMCTGYFSSLIRKNREKLPSIPSPYEDTFVEQLVPFLPNLKDAKFLGGEPFLIPIYYKIWEKIAEHNPNINVHITTNGTVLNQRVKSILEKLNCGIVMSIDSIEKDTYEKIRVNGRLETVMKNFEYFLEYTRRKKTWLTFAVCPITTNWKEMPGMVEFCNRKGINIFFNTVFQPFELSLRSKSQNELEEIIHCYKQQKLPVENYLERQNRDCFLDLTNQLNKWLSDKNAFKEKSATGVTTIEESLQSALMLSPPGRRNDENYKAVLKEFVSGDTMTEPAMPNQNYPFDPNFIDPEHFNQLVNTKEPVVEFLYNTVTNENKNLMLDAIVNYKHFLDGHNPSDTFVRKTTFILDWMIKNPHTADSVAETARGTAAKVFKDIDCTPLVLIREMMRRVEKKEGTE